VVCLLDPHTQKPGADITFPMQAATANAIRRITSGKVSAQPNRCARTMREALGWGLGDAHEWLRLPDVGFMSRPPGYAAQPGDIVVWPFTYGSHGCQHIGIAVGTQEGVELLSNLCGHICLSPLKPGYSAFFKPILTGMPAPPRVSAEPQIVRADSPGDLGGQVATPAMSAHE
jgi:hypothetical protein